MTTLAGADLLCLAAGAATLTLWVLAVCAVATPTDSPDAGVHDAARGE